MDIGSIRRSLEIGSDAMSDDQSRDIIIGFSKPRGWFKPYSWAIRLFEHIPYSHVYVKTFSNLTNQWLVYQASGVQVNFIGQKFFCDHAETVHEFTFKISTEAYKEYMRFAINNAGAPYDLKSVIGIMLIRILGLKKNFMADGAKSQYCAELVARVLKDFVGAEILESEFETAGPKRIYDICELLSFKEK